MIKKLGIFVVLGTVLLAAATSVFAATVDLEPDITRVSSQRTFWGYQEQYNIRIYNHGDTAVDSIKYHVESNPVTLLVHHQIEESGVDCVRNVNDRFDCVTGPIPAGGYVDIPWPMWAIGRTKFTLSVQVDPNQEIAETNETNNFDSYVVKR